MADQIGPRTWGSLTRPCTRSRATRLSMRATSTTSLLTATRQPPRACAGGRSQLGLQLWPANIGVSATPLPRLGMRAVVRMATASREAAVGAAREPVAAIPLLELAIHRHDTAEAFGRSQVLRTILRVGGLAESLRGTLGDTLGALAPVAVHHLHASYVVDRGSI